MAVGSRTRELTKSRDAPPFRKVTKMQDKAQPLIPIGDQRSRLERTGVHVVKLARASARRGVRRTCPGRSETGRRCRAYQPPLPPT